MPGSEDFSNITRVVGKLGRTDAFQLTPAKDAQRPKVRRSSKSMGHNVDNVCKHKMLRLGLFPLDRAIAECN